MSLNAKVEATTVVDGVLPTSPAFPIRLAKLRVVKQESRVKVAPEDAYASFEMDLEKGRTTMETWLSRNPGTPSLGAAYVTVEKIAP